MKKRNSEKLPYKMKLKLIRLVGERPLVNICLNNQETVALWDTGAMVSLMDSDFVKEKFPDSEIHPISEFTGNTELNLSAANQSKLSVQGVVILEFGVSKGKNLFQVPFLVTKDKISNPIIGYNTIEHLVTNYKNQINLPESLKNMIEDLSAEAVVNVIELIEEGDAVSELSIEAKLGKQQTIHPGWVQKVRCKMKGF